MLKKRMGVLVLCALFVTGMWAGCKEDTKESKSKDEQTAEKSQNPWPPKEEKDFMDSCMAEGMGVEVAKQKTYCQCSVDYLKERYTYLELVAMSRTQPKVGQLLPSGIQDAVVHCSQKILTKEDILGQVKTGCIQGAISELPVAEAEAICQCSADYLGERLGHDQLIHLFYKAAAEETNLFMEKAGVYCEEKLRSE